MIEISIHGLKRKLLRGECCAGAAPPDLPLDIVYQTQREIESRRKQLEPMAKLSEISVAREYLPYRED